MAHCTSACRERISTWRRGLSCAALLAESHGGEEVARRVAIVDGVQRLNSRRIQARIVCNIRINGIDALRMLMQFCDVWPLCALCMIRVLFKVCSALDDVCESKVLSFCGSFR